MSLRSFLSLCSTPKIADKDGGVGALARLYIPGYGYWFASGQTFSNPNSQLAQDTTMTNIGTDKPDTFIKAAGICGKGV